MYKSQFGFVIQCLLLERQLYFLTTSDGKTYENIIVNPLPKGKHYLAVSVSMCSSFIICMAYIARIPSANTTFSNLKV